MVNYEKSQGYHKISTKHSGSFDLQDLVLSNFNTNLQRRKSQNNEKGKSWKECTYWEDQLKEIQKAREKCENRVIQHYIYKKKKKRYHHMSLQSEDPTQS